MRLLDAPVVMSNVAVQLEPSPQLGADYWSQSRQPLTSLVFIAPLLVFYETGVLMLGHRAIRNGVDVWLRSLLDFLDFSQYFLLPVLTVSILLGWHYTTRQPWRVSRGVLSGMAIESIGLALALRVILQLELVFWRGFAGPLASLGREASVAADGNGVFAGMVGFLGAGVYEELLFRLIFLSLAVAALQYWGTSSRASTVAAVLLTSFIFSAAHYVGKYGEPILWDNCLFWFGATFRFLAGVFFSVLFACRGFGIAVGAHAGYDILVKLC